MRKQSKLPDPDRLMRRAARGDRAAFAAIYDATAPAVFGIALRILGDREQATDIAHQVYVTAWRSATSYNRTQGSVRAWLDQMARAHSIQRIRRDGRCALVPVAPHEPREEQSTMSEGASLVRAALDELPKFQRMAVELCYFDGANQRQIAAQLQTPPDTVCTSVRDGMRALDVRMEP